MKMGLDDGFVWVYRFFLWDEFLKTGEENEKQNLKTISSPQTHGRSVVKKSIFSIS